MSRRPASSSTHSSDTDRLITDRQHYISFLEQQLERVSSAAQNITVMDEKLNHMKEIQNTYEAKISNLAKLVKLDKQHTAKIKSETSEYTDNLKKRLLYLEEKSKEKLDKIEEQMLRLESMYSAFPADANAINSNGSSQPVGLPGFIASYIHALFAQHTQQTATALTHQAQTHQIHLQNWVQEYIKTTHPSSKLLDEVNSFKVELHSLSHKLHETENRVLQIIDKRMSGYTEIYQSMEERFLNVIDVHHKKITEPLQMYENKLNELKQIQNEWITKMELQQKEHQTLNEEVQTQKNVTNNFLSVMDEMKLKLDSGILDFNTNMNSLVLDLRSKTWHAEQTCSRLAVDTIARQNIFHAKLEKHLQTKTENIQGQLDNYITQTKNVQQEFIDQLQQYENRMEKLNKKTENKIQTLTNAIKDKFDSSDNPPPPPPPPPAPVDPNPALLTQLSNLSIRLQSMETELFNLRREIETSQCYLKNNCEQNIKQQIQALHLQLDKEMDAKLWLLCHPPVPPAPAAAPARASSRSPPPPKLTPKRIGGGYVVSPAPVPQSLLTHTISSQAKMKNKQQQQQPVTTTMNWMEDEDDEEEEDHIFLHQTKSNPQAQSQSQQHLQQQPQPTQQQPPPQQLQQQPQQQHHTAQATTTSATQTQDKRFL